MKITTKIFFFSILLTLLGCSGQNGIDTTKTIDLFNGQDLRGWNFYLAKPDSSIDIPGYSRDKEGNYLKPLASEDPLHVFTVTELDGEPVIRISGQVIGNLYTKKSFGNYHLKLKFKWGNIKWPWMQGRPKDGGILYHYNKYQNMPGIRHEFQIHEGDVGSYWAKNTIVDIPSHYTSNLPSSIKKAKPFLCSLVPELRDTMLIFDSEAVNFHFKGTNKWQIVMANPLNEKPSGEWNTLELICFENHAVHIVNGKVNMAVLNGYYTREGKKQPHTQGSIQLQSEGAELFFKDIQLTPLETMPEIFNAFLEK